MLVFDSDFKRYMLFCLLSSNSPSVVFNHCSRFCDGMNIDEFLKPVAINTEDFRRRGIRAIPGRPQSA